MQKNVIAVEEALKRVVNNKKLFHRLLSNFSGRKMVEDIEKALQAGDSEEAARACHALRGLAANLSMQPLADITSRLEECIKSGEASEVLLIELNGNLDAVEEAIEEILSDTIST